MKYGVFFTILILTYNNLAFAQEELLHIQYIEPVSCKTFIPPPSIYRDRHILQKISTGPLTLEFDDNVPDPIKNGVEIAVAIWNSLLKSDVNVTIQVGWEYYSKNIAGGHAKGFDPVLQNDVWYPKALANALSGYDINGSLPEMRLVFNSNSEIKWFTDINGTPGAGEVDLITIALHEICHGLGWTGSFDYDEKTKKGSWGIEEESISYPMIFDKFVDNNIFQLIDLHEFNNPSLELGTQLTSNHIYFNGPETKAVYNTNKPLLYSPVAWAPGRSVYHLDEDSFQKGTLNSLMTPNFYPEEVVHTPGEIILASLKDMGWDINRTMEIFSPSEWSAWTVGATYNIKWSDTETGTVCIGLVDENGNQTAYPDIATSVMSRPGENIYQWDINFAIASGSYKIKIHDNSGNLSLSQKFSIVGSVLQAPSPVLSPSSGYYSPGQKISMECGNGAQIRYTIDGNIPTENSTLYTSEIILATTTTIKARSFKTGMNPSQIVTVAYFIGEPLQQIRIEQKYGIAPYAYNFFPLHFWKDDNWNETFQSYNSVYSGSDIFIKFHQEYRESTKERFAYSKTEPTTVNNYLNYSQYEPYSTTGIDHYIANFLPSYNATINSVYEDGVILSSDTVSFSDPWLYDLVHPVLGKRNRGIDAIFYPHVFPFSPNTSESGPGSDYRGVLPNQSFLNNVYYKVRYLPRKIFINSTGRNHWFYLYNWSSNGKANFNTPNSNQTGVVFTADIAQIYAHIKGTQLSTSSNAFNSTNQRKFVRSGNGMLHLVYESMSKVWYETSTDNGANWKIMNGGKPLSVNNSQFPSIALDDINWAYITYYNSEYGVLEMQCFNYNTDVKVGSLSYSLYVEQPQMTPIISCDTQGADLVITFKANCVDDQAGILSPGLYCRAANYNNLTHVFEWKGGLKKIEGTNENSFYPAMDCYLPKYAPYVYHLAWQQNSETAASQIKYCKLTNTNGVITQNDDATVSNLSYANNSIPSVIVLKDGIPRVSWTAVNGLTKRAMLRGRTSAPGSPWSGTFSSFGSNVTSVNINKHLTGTVGGYILGWNQSTASWFIRNTNFNEIVNTSLFGKDLQINNGSLYEDFSKMYGIVFDASNLPYYFQQSPALNVNLPLSKEGSDNLVLETRAAVVTTEDNKYTYSIGNIIADDVSINFKEVSDTVSSFNIMDLNNIMITEEFSISDESTIRFSIASQVLDSLKALAELQNSNVTFRAELIDADQQKVLFILDELKLNETTKTFTDTKNYELNTAGLGTKTVKLRLVTENSFPAKFYIENHYDQTFLLEKEKYVELTNYQNIVINDYDLFQNYPNPFNPATTITYQLPKAGFVTLKIFDMIGKEVAVLADGFKQEGQYSVDFNAGSLASGLYFYELKVNDFSATKKMMLIK